MIARRALLLAVLALLALAATASGASVSLKCGGKGKHLRNNVGTVLCAAQTGKARTIEGVVRDDSNKPVAGPVTVTVSKWVPKGGYYSIEKVKTLTVAANATGKFSYAAKTATKISIKFEAGGALAEAEVSRELGVRVKKLGGGKVKVTVKGYGKAPVKMFLVDDSGYPLPGTAGKRLSKAGVAIFNVGGYHGPASWVFEAGDYEDLFWTNRGPTFRI